MRARLTRLIVAIAARFFGFISGVVRNARTFHPDGRVFLSTVRSLDPSDASLAWAANQLAGAALMRVGMGMMKKGMPGWLARLIPDAPSIATRIYSTSTLGEIRLQRVAGEDVDILFTAGGDRLWKLVWNLATGGRRYGLHKYDYFRNHYYADVPYRIDNGKLDVWLRIAPADLPPDSPKDDEGRERGLTNALARHATVHIEAQRVGASVAPFVPIAEIRFEEEIKIDQEALHFDPLSGRGFEPHGFLTALREKVYPASVRERPASSNEREMREREGFVGRLCRYLSAHLSSGHARTGCGIALCAFFIVVPLLAGLYAAWRFLPDRAVEYDNNEDHFKYGSTGGERNLGFPFWIWQAAPLVCSDTLDRIAHGRLAQDFLERVGNYNTRPTGQPEVDRMELSREAYHKAFGMIYEPNAREKNLPVGISKRRNMGLDRVFVNCAVCHSSTVRVSDEPGAEHKMVLGMPANLFNLRDFERFYFECAAGDRFSKERLIPEIERLGADLDLLDRYVVYPLAIWIMRDRVQSLTSRLSFFYKQPDWGPGRVDTFSNAKGIFNWPWRHLPDWHKDKRVEPDQVGTADFPSIWLQGPRKMRSSDDCPMELHWDGNNDMMEERNLSAAFGTGALPPIIDHEAIGRIEKWLLDKKPSEFRDHFPIDQRSETKGRLIYETYCLKCHGTNGRDFTGERVGHVTPIDKIGTDPYRFNNYTKELALVQSMLYAGEKKPDPLKPTAKTSTCKKTDPAEAEENSYRFKHFHKTPGYANMPLDGIWLRAPYLHNGSVPTLWHLLQPADERPKVIYRGNDLYDPKYVGFVWDREEEPNGFRYFRFDTEIPGNTNVGHEYGTHLSNEEKWALVEYLKTF